MSLLATLDTFVDELRAVGIPVSVSEKIDAACALGLVDLADRSAVRDGLAVTLVKAVEHEGVFDVVFETVFGTRPTDSHALADGAQTSSEGVPGDAPPTSASGFGGFGALDDATVRRLLIESLESDQQASLLQQRLAALLVERFAGISPGRAVAGTYYLYRVMRQLDPDQLLIDLMARAEQRQPPIVSDRLGQRLAREEYEQRLAGLRGLVEFEIRRRLVEDRGAVAVVKTLRQPLPEDINFLTASRTQVEQLRDIVQPLSRKLGTRMTHKRKHGRHGSVDFRATMRASMSTGGIPIDIRHHSPRPRKPELVVLADISGSVATFAAFTLQLASALRTEFSRVRCFVFVDGLDEVTDLLASATNIVEVTSEINRRGLGVWFNGSSDYGNAISTFWQDHGAGLRSRTTLLILGDARSNYHSPRAELLAKISGRAGRTYWLNPEPRTSWDSGDSVIGTYAPYCDEVVECRNLRQLRAFVEQLA